MRLTPATCYGAPGHTKSFVPPLPRKKLKKRGRKRPRGRSRHKTGLPGAMRTELGQEQGEKIVEVGESAHSLHARENEEHTFRLQAVILEMNVAALSTSLGAARRRIIELESAVLPSVLFDNDIRNKIIDTSCSERHETLSSGEEGLIDLVQEHGWELLEEGLTEGQLRILGKLRGGNESYHQRELRGMQRAVDEQEEEHLKLQVQAEESHHREWLEMQNVLDARDKELDELQGVLDEQDEEHLVLEMQAEEQHMRQEAQVEDLRGQVRFYQQMQQQQQEQRYHHQQMQQLDQQQQPEEQQQQQQPEQQQHQHQHQQQQQQQQ
jgi:hypothetical protein